MPGAERITRRLGGPLALLITLLGAREASAFCQATTCDPKKETCHVNENNCVTDGEGLHWETRCVSFGVQENGSPRRHISFATADAIIGGALTQWADADCGGGAKPSFRVWDLGSIVCDVPEFNPTKPNANVWMFRDASWPYEGETTTLALTSTLFDTKTGALLDADVEINSFARELTTTKTNVKQDLASIVTHEAGHFLGLAHTLVKTATMYAQYQAGDLNYRSIEPDDIKGICSIYPPNRAVPQCSQPSPPHGFSRYCGGGTDAASDPQIQGCKCRFGKSEPDGANTAAVVITALLAVAFIGRRRRR